MMDIVDGQVHSNVMGTETTLAVMDAIGIQAVLIDEYLRPDEAGGLLPGYSLAGGAFRPVGPNAEAAALAYPDRFAYLMRINSFDPGLEGWIETLAASPNLRALRTVAFSPEESVAFEAGGFDRLFAAANAHNLPIFVTCPARVPHLAPYARKFPDLQFVIDHCGVAFDAPRGGASLDDTIAMAEYKNVALKWAHAPAFLSTEPYPFPDLEPKLARALDAFGPERVLWASDYTVSRHRQNWAESLFTLRHSPTLSATDKDWILGRTIRTLLRWPAPEKPFAHKPMHPHRLGGVG
ncbi:MAG: amidohydrolase [Rhodospirillales bacterium]|nr:amidohydrolase [Rhodospirillales bacterium]